MVGAKLLIVLCISNNISVIMAPHFACGQCLISYR